MKKLNRKELRKLLLKEVAFVKREELLFENISDRSTHDEKTMNMIQSLKPHLSGLGLKLDKIIELLQTQNR